jgi:hypothetical protein
MNDARRSFILLSDRRKFCHVMCYNNRFVLWNLLRLFYTPAKKEIWNETNIKDRRKTCVCVENIYFALLSAALLCAVCVAVAEESRFSILHIIHLYSIRSVLVPRIKYIYMMACTYMYVYIYIHTYSINSIPCSVTDVRRSQDAHNFIHLQCKFS